MSTNAGLELIHYFDFAIVNGFAFDHEKPFVENIFESLTDKFKMLFENAIQVYLLKKLPYFWTYV